MDDQNQGRGWHGDPEGHARAGRKGGKVSGRRRREISAKRIKDNRFLEDQDLY